MAHLLEHMMFKGTPTPPQRARSCSRSTAASANGSTWYDRTNYFETLPASQDNLDWALELEADRMVNATIAPDDLKTEFSVVRNEFEMRREQPGERSSTSASCSTAYLWHNYGKSTIGSRADIERVPVAGAARVLREVLPARQRRADRRRQVRRRRGARARSSSTFGAIPRPTRTLAPTYTVEPVQDGERAVTLRRTGDVAIVELAYHGVAGSVAGLRRRARRRSTCSTREPSGRLYKKLVETKLAATVSGGAASRARPVPRDVRRRGPRPRRTSTRSSAIDDRRDRGARRLEDRRQGRRALARVEALKELELAMANSQEIAVELSEFIALGDWRTMFAYRDRVAKVTAADVAARREDVLQGAEPHDRQVHPDARTPIARRSPRRPTSPRTSRASRAARSRIAARRSPRRSTTSRRARRASELAGGIKAALLAEEDARRQGRARAAPALGRREGAAGQGDASARLMGAADARAARRSKSFQELARPRGPAQGARLSSTASADGLTLHIETLRDKLPAALELAAEILTTPAFSDKELEIAAPGAARGARAAAAGSWRARVRDVRAAVGEVAEVGSALRRVAGRADRGRSRSCARATITRVLQEFAGAGHGELAVVGDFDARRDRRAGREAARAVAEQDAVRAARRTSRGACPASRSRSTCKRQGADDDRARRGRRAAATPTPTTRRG